MMLHSTDIQYAGILQAEKAKVMQWCLHICSGFAGHQHVDPSVQPCCIHRAVRLLDMHFLSFV